MAACFGSAGQGCDGARLGQGMPPLISLWPTLLLSFAPCLHFFHVPPAPPSSSSTASAIVVIVTIDTPTTINDLFSRSLTLLSTSHLPLRLGFSVYRLSTHPRSFPCPCKAIDSPTFTTIGLTVPSSSWSSWFSFTYSLCNEQHILSLSQLFSRPKDRTQQTLLFTQLDP